MPKVSVIIITYNRSTLLGSAIASVLNQTYQDFELIVVDDASPDNTAEVVRGINDPRIRYIRHETNQREAGARNTGVQNARGEYIAFLDDDDEWLPEKLQRQVEVLDGSPQEVGAVYTGFVKIGLLTGKSIERVIPTKRGIIFQEMLTQNWVGTPSTVLLRKTCFQKVGLFDQALVFGPDYDMWIRISTEFQFEYIPEPLVRYFVHENSMSANYALIIQGMETSNRKNKKFFSMNRRAFSERFYLIGVFYCFTGNVRKGRESLMRAIQLYPFDLRYYFRLSLCFLGAAGFNSVHSLKERLTSWFTKETIC